MRPVCEGFYPRTARRDAALRSASSWRSSEASRSSLNIPTKVSPAPKHAAPDSMRCMADARKRKFSVVLVAAFDRVARSTRHFLQVTSELDSLGIEFVSRRENIDTSGPMGRLFLTLIASIAELEADLIKERIRAGMRRRKLEGLPPRSPTAGR